MVDAFEAYEEDYCSISASISRKISELPSVSKAKSISTVNELEKEISAGERILHQMENVVKGLAPIARTKLMPKVTRFRSDLDTLKRDYRRVKTKYISAEGREDLLGLGNRNKDSGVESSDPRTRLLDTTDRISQSNKRLEESHRLASQTEEVGVAIMSDLRVQRDTLNRARTNLRETDSNLSRTRKILNSMARRIITNKLILGAIILLELLCLGLVIWFKYFK
eukprot:GILJ01003214.1.p1 GENE.GILJ01003214.1~~GILJ01003214.1.p1  ORF type:complete len:224 (+),score=27.01 GILJ01003214.1:1310-1981(+)